MTPCGDSHGLYAGNTHNLPPGLNTFFPGVYMSTYDWIYFVMVAANATLIAVVALNLVLPRPGWKKRFWARTENPRQAIAVWFWRLRRRYTPRIKAMWEHAVRH